MKRKLAVAVVCMLAVWAGIMAIRQGSPIESDGNGSQPGRTQGEDELTKRYSRLAREYPSAEVDDNVAAVDILWFKDWAELQVPKTYGFGATRFASREVSIPRADIRGAVTRGDHIFLSVPVEVYYGSSPDRFPSELLVAIPKRVVPKDFLPDSGATGPAKSARTAAVTTGAPGLLRHKDNANGFSILYPADWERLPEEWARAAKGTVPKGEALLFAMCSRDRTLNMLLKRQLLSRPMSSAAFFAATQAAVSKQGMIAPRGNSEQIDIQGIPAVKYTVEMTAPGGRPMKSTALYLARGRVGWAVVIGGQPAAFDLMRGTCTKVLESLMVE